MLGDRYRLDEFIASGGMGQVWRGTDTVLARTVAVKVLLPSLLADPDFEARFRAEARIMAGFRHAGVVDVYDYGESSEAAGPDRHAMYLVMAYVDGEPLSQRISAAGHLSVAETMSVVAQAADALQAAHDGGIIHRDVKPGNLLVQADGTVILVDFGVARSTTVTAVTTGNAIPGTALYMAPEQASGRPVSGATDVYALGAVAYHCLTGEPPFSGDNPLQVALKHLQDPPPPLPDDIPEPVRTLVERALAKDPADRYPSAAALAAAARAALAATSGAVGLAAPLVMPPLGAIRRAGPGPTTAHDLQPVTPFAAAAASRQRHRAAAVGVLIALLIVGGVLIAALGLRPKGHTPAPADQRTASSSPTVKTSRPGGRTVSPTRPAASSAPVSVAPPVSATAAPATSAPPVHSAPPTTTTAPPPSAGGPTASGGPTAIGTGQPAYGAAGRHRVRGAATL
jgi:hypothetical protein